MSDRRPGWWAAVLRRRIAVISLVAFIVVAAICLAAPVIAPYSSDAIDLERLKQPPSAAHLMGTDDLGRDVLSRVLYGGRISILIGILAALLGTTIGTAIGALAGTSRSWVDNLLMRLTDVAAAIPTLPLLIVLSAYSGAAVLPMVAIIAGLSWMATARVVRAEMLSLKTRAFVEAARCLGQGRAAVVLRHLVPNAFGSLIVGATLGVGNAILIESSLSFLGLGVQPPVPTWGNMLMDAQVTMASSPWLTIFPGAAILIVVLAVNFFGDALRDALDPSVSA